MKNDEAAEGDGSERWWGVNFSSGCNPNRIVMIKLAHNACVLEQNKVY